MSKYDIIINEIIHFIKTQCQIDLELSLDPKSLKAEY